MTITVTIIKYHPDIYFDPEGAEKSIRLFERLFGAKNIAFDKKNFTINSYKAKRLDDGFDIGGKHDMTIS